MNKNPLSNILGIFNRLTLQQKLVIGGVVAVTIVLLASLLFFMNKPSYAILYSNLTQEDASKVIDQLNNDKTPFLLEGNGTTIKVPKEKVYETRINLAGKGIPNSGVVGYEIFDKNTMGMSDFMQKLNYKRALEGELARTIMQVDGVKGVRVLIVFPEKSVFKNEEKLPTASVVLKLDNNFNLTKSNVAAILNLVSSSVEGLQPNKVTLLDTKGRLLSRDTDENSFAASSVKQYEIKESVEKHLIQKAQSILDNVLGYGNAIVQVNADLNFDQVEKNMELYDPESQVAVSEQKLTTVNSGNTAGDTASQQSQNSTTNYEISKTIQKVIEGSGNIKHLTVAVVLNNVSKEVQKDGKAETISEPRSPDQVQKLEGIIKNAVGFTPQRNDLFSIVNIPFETQTFDDVTPVETPFYKKPEQLINLILILSAIIASIFLLKGIMNRLKNEKILIGTFDPAYAAESSQPQATESLTEKSRDAKQLLAKKKREILPIGDLEDEISEEAINKKNQQDKIVNYVSKNPVDAAKLINSWLHEDEL